MAASPPILQLWAPPHLSSPRDWCLNALVVPLLQVQQLWAPLHHGGEAQDRGTQAGHLPREWRSGEGPACGSKLHDRLPAALHTAGMGDRQQRGRLSDVDTLRKLALLLEVQTWTSQKTASRQDFGATSLSRVPAVPQPD